MRGSVNPSRFPTFLRHFSVVCCFSGESVLVLSFILSEFGEQVHSTAMLAESKRSVRGF